MLTRCIPLATFLTILLAPIAAATAADLPLPAPRTFGRGAVIDHRVYLFGGGVGPFDVFDTQARTWSRIAADIPPSIVLYGDQIGGKLYLLDGATRRFVALDPATGRTTPLRAIPTKRVNGTVIAAQGKLFVIGGYSEDVNERNCVEVYDPQTDAWSTGPALPGYQPRDHFHSAAVLDGKLHVVGGLLKENRDQPHFRLDGDHWTRLANAPLHALWKHAGLAAAAGELYLLCPLAILPNNQGNADKDAANFYHYDPKADRWQPLGRAPRGMPIAHFIAATVSDRIYYFDGLAPAGSNAPMVRVYDVKTGRWQ